jgi:hypothetical protein
MTVTRPPRRPARTRRHTALRTSLCLALTALLAGCPFVPGEGAPATVRHVFALTPERAAACFARNAERHSSALTARVGPADARGVVTVDVEVKNGVPYARPNCISRT